MGYFHQAASYHNAWVSWKELAQCSGAVYVPTELYRIHFTDMYAMGVPLLSPDTAWMLRIFRGRYLMWQMMSPEFRYRPPACNDTVRTRCVDHRLRRDSDLWPFGEPYINVMEEPAEKLAYWYTLADVERYPHVLHFASLSEFTLQIAELRHSAQELSGL